MLKRLSRWTIPFALFLITFFSYGIFAFQQGFHWDDWGFAWLIQTLGRPGFFDYFSINRPFLAYVYSVTTSLFGTNPVAWQLFSLLMRWLTAVSLWYFLRMIWPEHKQGVFLVSVFFLIYPGFNQQAIAITYSHFFLAQTLLFLSFILMLWFARQPRRYWWAALLAAGFSAFNLFSIEYFFGLELLRPLFLWIFLQKQQPNQKLDIKRFILFYLPFLAVLAWFLYWRITFEFGYQLALVNDISASPLERLAAIPTSILEQLRVAGWLAWVEIFQLPDFSNYGPRLTAVFIAVVVLTGIGLHKFLERYRSSEDRGWQFPIQWIGLGLFALFLAGIPFLIGDFPVRLTFPNSRFLLPFALGAAFFLVAFLELLSKWKYEILLASVLAAMAVGAQFNNGYLWREDWRLQKDFFWQLAWRIPDLQPGSILLSSDTPFEYSSDNSLTYPLNLIYDPDNHSTEIKYAYLFVSVRLGHELEALKPGLPIHQDYLAATFDSSSDDMVAVHFSPPGCFRVLHPIYDQDLPLAPAVIETADKWLETGVPILPRTAASAMELSNLGEINTKRTESPKMPVLLGPEPTHKWCYFFEKADLARQEDDWEKVTEIGDQVFSIPYYPDDLSEYLPFIEAYARIGRWEDARDLTRKTANFMPILRPALCAIWQRVETDSGNSISPDQIEKMKAELGYCPLP